MLTPTEILGPDGSIARRLANYESRPQQIAMADAVAASLDKPEHLVVEAGTGVGKSFAYLVPAILWATAAEAIEQPPSPSDDDDSPTRTRRVVISTHTINLQEQIIHKDLPLLSSVIPREFTSVLVKGRRNYISLRRLKSAQKRAVGLLTTPEEFDHLRQIGDHIEVAGGTGGGFRQVAIAGVLEEVLALLVEVAGLDIAQV